MTMKLHQPILFVGLGGTGCSIGVELERRLREDLCGPDGSALMRDRPGAGFAQYQLPSCVQFVYADVNQGELDRLPARAVPSEEHVRTVTETAHYVRDLVPALNTYPEVAANLRLMASEYVDWLPPAQGEPRVAPLSRGAGQLPTVGRAALFETLRHGTRPVTRDLSAAVGRLATCGEDLRALGGAKPTAVDVFVAFSVAGGTGAGIFYDYLHLIGEVLRQSTLGAKIYPLVVMPSAFPNGSGGGRAAQLNAGRALLDLFRLVDQQNASDVDRDLGGYDPTGANRAIRSDRAAVHYPGQQPYVLRPSTVQTGFLFSLPLGAERPDLHRSVVSLILSLIATELVQAGDTEQHQSFADSFINGGVTREVPASNGIGNSGVSTAQVASLTVPLDDLADMVAGRLLSLAVNQLSVPGHELPEENAQHINEFFARAGIQAAIGRASGAFVEPEPATGAGNVTLALRDRGQSMVQSLRELQGRLPTEVGQILEGFDPRGAALGLLGPLDPFRVERVLFGHQGLTREAERGGALGVMQRLRQDPPNPAGFVQSPPGVPALRDRMARRVKWADDEPVLCRETQDDWYRWRTRSLWAQAWDQQSPRWTRPMDQLRTRWRRFTDALREQARSDADRFRSRSEDLLRARVGVAYLLHGGRDLVDFYDRVIFTVTERLAAQDRLRPTATESELVMVLTGPERWRQAYQAACEGQPDRAVSLLREQLKEDLRRFLQDGGTDDAPPLLPSLAVRLRLAAEGPDGERSDPDLQDFTYKLAGLVPAGFAPQGTGPMKVLVTYPAESTNPKIEQYLRDVLLLPQEQNVDIEWRAIGADSLSVVMFRFGMGVTEVEEVREVLRVWAQALPHQLPEDFLKWRQRTGYDFSYLATREEHRVVIVHHLLAALWNGRVRVTGDEGSPQRVTVVLDGDVAMHLTVFGLDQASSWASLARAYELGALEDDRELRRNFCRQLMRESPKGIGSSAAPPDPLYWTVCGMAAQQIKILDELLARVPASTRPRAEQLRQFWAETLPAARHHEFSVDSPVTRDFAELEMLFRDDGTGRPR